ncbi:glycosyltransferase [Nostoc sp. PCC 7524]|uniref:glycosyltransferase family 4 protein n=1 Tax=Nostoc sp. (strain ATCC 29411 / PCC 7524) TaxID=28072 RepID=UPI00029EF481|nr:glycosyltransferase family 4 protein [Nostoc sp. PCC 7524]AFY46219.1 glycosyltransferase [Nostoc sp. PCC 7524]
MMKINNSQKLRVAVVGPYPLNPSKVVGGIQAAVRNQVNGLKNFEDLELHVVTVDFDGQNELVPQPAIQFHIRKSSQGLNQFLLYYLDRQWVTRTVKEIKPDVVHIHGTNFYAYAAQTWDFPTVFSVHGVTQTENKFVNYQEVGLFHRLYRKTKSYFNTYFEVESLKNARHVIIISPYVTDVLKNYHIENLHFINNPVDEPYFQLEDRSQPNRILFAGIIHARKGILTLIKAIELVRQVEPDVELHVVGKVYESEYEAMLKSYVQTHQLEKYIIFRGHLNDEELHQAFAECQMLVLPSQEEVSPMVIQQAMAVGKSVVATAVGGVPYLVEDGKTGLLVPYGDPEALSKAMIKLLANPEEAKRLGARGREIARDRFRVEYTCNQTRNLYYELADKSLSSLSV